MEASTTPSGAQGPAREPPVHDPAHPLQGDPSPALPAVGPANAVTLQENFNPRRGVKRAAGSESSVSSSTSSHSHSRAHGKSAQARHRESAQSLQYPTVSSSTIATPSAATSNSSLRTTGTTGHNPVPLPVLVRAYPSPNTPTTATTTATSPVTSNMPRSKRESRKGPTSPPPSAFDFASILQSITPAVQPSLDSIAEICAKSRMSLASDYQAHLPPHGAGRLLETVGEEGGFDGEEGKGKGRLLDDDASLGGGEPMGREPSREARNEKSERPVSGFASWFPRMQFGGGPREPPGREMRTGGGDAIGALRGCLKS